MKLPIIGAESVKARIGIESGLGGFSMRTRAPELRITRTPTQISAPTPMPELQLDQSRMWEAFNGGKLPAFTNRIYSQMPQIALQGIAKIVEDGNRMGDLRNGGDPISDIAFESMSEGYPSIEYFGPATSKNVDIHFEIHKPDTRVEVGGVDIQADLAAPEIEYERKDVRIRPEQYPSVRFHVSNLDMQA